MVHLSQKDKLGLVIGGVAAVGFLALIATNVALSKKEKLDDRSCTATIASKAVFLIDRSDDTPTQTVDEIKRRIAIAIRDDVAQGDLVSIFYVTQDTEKNLQPVFSRCKPQEHGNEAYEDSRSLERKFKASFEKPLEMALAEQVTGSVVSPLAETFTDFLASDYLDGQTNRLFIFSDLMQHSQALSLYGCSDRADAVAKYRASRAGAIERPELKNVQVSLNIIPRHLTHSEVQCRDGFWAWYFGNDEGEKAGISSRYLPGGN